ncbi:MAG: ABC transporter ATP-binding protein [Clostridia bacterium]|nr:ABC transporter ATP-binding protein [Clostridia bacterium]
MEVNRYNQDEKNTSFSFLNYKRGLTYIKKYKVKLFIVFILNCISVVTTLSITKMLQYVIDDIIPSSNYEKLFIMILVAFLLVLISIVLTRVYLKILAQVNQNIVEDIRNDLFSHIQYLSFNYYDTRPHGKILVRLTEYAQDVSTLITDKLVTTFLNIFNMLIILIFMFFTNVKLTLIAIVGIIVLSLIFAITAKIKRKYKLLINNKNSNLNAYLVESLRGIQTTQSFNREKKNQQIFNSLSEEWKNVNCRYIKFGNIGWCSVQIMSHFVTAAIYFIGAMFLYPNVSIGVIVAMGSYSSNFWQPIEDLFKTLDDFINSITYLERIFETMDEEIEIKDTKSAIDISLEGLVEFKNVTFSYINNIKVLDNISFKVEPQEKIAIVGETGSGKTTITNLIGRFYDIDSGNIYIDEKDIKSITLNSLRKQISIMQQENYLFSTSIMKNLKYGTKYISNEKVIKLCQKLNIHNWIMSLENGYDTILSNNGKNLSDGEKQVLCYTRTIINNPKILIFDEATSKIDVKTEKMLQNLTKELIKDKTVITIAHRLSTIVNCNKILFIKNKKIVECGTHKQLMELKGNYYNLYMSQVETFS